MLQVHAPPPAARGQLTQAAQAACPGARHPQPCTHRSGQAAGPPARRHRATTQLRWPLPMYSALCISIRRLAVRSNAPARRVPEYNSGGASWAVQTRLTWRS